MSAAAAGEVLLWVARAGVEASAIAGLVLLVQWLLRDRVSARWRYNLWFLVVARLLLPAVPGTPLSPFNLLDYKPARDDAAAAYVGVGLGPTRPVPLSHTPRPASRSTTRTPPPPPPPTPRSEPADFTAAPIHIAPLELRRQAIAAAGTDPSPLPSPRGRGEGDESPAPLPVVEERAAPARRVDWVLLGVLVWLAGASLLAARLAWSGLRLAVAVRRMPPADDAAVGGLLKQCVRQLRIRRTPQLLLGPDELGPALVGVLRPRLLVPASAVRALDERELRLVLLHELAHLKRRDVAVNWLLAGLQVVHWFNPLLWLAFARMRADRELACDEAVLASASRDEAGAYGPTVIKLLQILAFGPRHAANVGGAAAVPAGAVGMLGVLDGKAHLRRRITMIARFNPSAGSRRRWSAAGLALSLLLGGVALTGAVRADPDTRDAAAPAAAPATTPAVADPVALPPLEDEPAAGLAPVAPGAGLPSTTVEAGPAVGLPATTVEAAPGAGLPPPSVAPSAEARCTVASGDVIEIFVPGADGKPRVLQISIVDDKGYAALADGLRVRAAGLTEEQLAGAVIQAMGDRLPDGPPATSVRLSRRRVDAVDPNAAEVDPRTTPALPTPELAPPTPTDPTAPFPGLVPERLDTPSATLPQPPQPGLAPGTTPVPVPEYPPTQLRGGGAPGSPYNRRPGSGYGAPPSPPLTPYPGSGYPGARNPYGRGTMPGSFQPPAAGSYAPMARIEDAEAREADAATSAKLRKPVQVDLLDKPLAEALDYLADAADVTIFPDWRALEAVGLSRDVPVTLRLKGPVTAERALRWVVKAAGGESIGWALDSGVVVVSIREQLNAMTITRAYDVADLLNQEARRMTSAGQGPEGGNGAAEVLAAAAGENLTVLIQETVPTGGVREFGGHMFITATEPNHREVQKLFDLLRRRPGSASDGEVWPPDGAPAPGTGPGRFPGGTPAEGGEGGAAPAPHPKPTGPSQPRSFPTPRRR